MLSPKKVKWRKVQTGRMKGKAYRGGTLHFADHGLRAEECGWVTARQIEAARIAMTRHVKRGATVWIRIFPNKPITKKPAEVRMGKGKGSVEEWVAVVKPGRIIYEMGGEAGVDVSVIREALRLAAHKLPVKTRIVSKEYEAIEARENARKAEARKKKKAERAASASA